ncbi:efflux RND transporter periplasmic adaptor subunit [Salinimonas marina]|nr:efflux RND transporter periplasmic adaptor subunit [Salinimonas marina]
MPRVWLLTLLVSGLTACSEAPESKGDGSDKPSQGAKQAIPVGFVNVSLQPIGYIEKLPGRVVSYRKAEIRPQVSGIIQARMFEEGTLVEKGQQLYQIDPERYQADVEVAQANLENANAQVENAQTLVNRYDSLAKNNTLSQQELDDATTRLKQARASVSQAEAQLKNANINLAYTRVYAPISGFIGPSEVTEGALVTQQQTTPLATIRQLDPVYVDLAQSVGDAQALKARLIESRVQKRDDAEFSVSLFFSQSGEPYEHTGRLEATDLSVDQQTGAIRLRSVFPNPDNKLLPGLFVRASIAGLASSKALTVPQKSVQIGQGGARHVWVVTPDNKAAKQAVETGLAYNNRWVIEQGLKPGDKVIVQGTMNLQEGAPVKPKALKSADANSAGLSDSAKPSTDQGR